MKRTIVVERARDWIFYKLGGIVCFAVAIFLAIQINHGFQLAGYVLVILHVIILVLLGVLGLVGAGFGFVIYDLVGCSLYFAGIIVFLTVILSVMDQGVGFFIMGGFSLIYGLILAAIGSKILERGEQLKAEREKKSA